jgi:hypothetical protein
MPYYNCKCEELYDSCVERVKSSLSTHGSVIIDRTDLKNPCNNKMIQYMVIPFLHSYFTDSNYSIRLKQDKFLVPLSEPDTKSNKSKVEVEVEVEVESTINKKTLSIAIRDKRLIG